MHIPITPLPLPLPLLLAAFILVVATVSAAPSPSPTTTTTHEINPSAPLSTETTSSLPYIFTLDAFLFSNSSNFLSFGFPRNRVNTLGVLGGRKSTFVLKGGKVGVRGKGKDLELEVGAPALRQGVVLLPKGQGVPVRAVIGGFEGEGKRTTTVIEVDDEKVLADFAITRGFVTGAPLALADRRPFVNPGLVKFRVTPVYY